MADQVPQQSRSRATQDLRFRTSMDLNEPLDLGISRDIHDQIDAMVVDEIVDAVADRDAQLPGSREPRCVRVAIHNPDDLNRRDEMQQVEESGAASSCTVDRDFRRSELRDHHPVRQRLHGMTPWMEGRDHRPSPTSYQREHAHRCASSLCSMARATDSRSFSPSTGLTR